MMFTSTIVNGSCKKYLNRWYTGVHAHVCLTVYTNTHIQSGVLVNAQICMRICTCMRALASMIRELITFGMSISIPRTTNLYQVQSLKSFIVNAEYDTSQVQFGKSTKRNQDLIFYLYKIWPHPPFKIDQPFVLSVTN